MFNKIFFPQNVAVGLDLLGHNPLQTNARDIPTQAFLHFNDVSTKFSASAVATGNIITFEGTSIAIDNVTVAFALGLGMAESSSKVYFAEMPSANLALQQKVQWQKVGVMDISIPIAKEVEYLDFGLAMNPIISITSSDLFTELPSLSIDISLE